MVKPLPLQPLTDLNNEMFPWCVPLIGIIGNV